jgi:hypothetical protein
MSNQFYGVSKLAATDPVLCSVEDYIISKGKPVIEQGSLFSFLAEVGGAEVPTCQEE